MKKGIGAKCALWLAPIVVGGEDNYPPYNYLDASGNPALTWSLRRRRFTGWAMSRYFLTSTGRTKRHFWTVASTRWQIWRERTIVVSSGGAIIASNNEELIGKSTDDIAILRESKKNAKSDKLVHTRREAGSLSQNFGLMEQVQQGRRQGGDELCLP